MDKTMDFLAQIGYFGPQDPMGCCLYGLVLMLACVFLAFTMEKPAKED
jgi:hypothetical protein